MSIRIRETRGTSWKGTKPGTRHWRSRSVSMGLGWWLIGTCLWYFIWYCGVVPVAFCLWLAVETALLVSSAILVLVLMAMYRRGPSYLKLTRWGWFWVLELELP